MRPKDTQFAGPAMSPHMLALRRQLPAAGAGASPATLGLVTALTELRLVCDDVLSTRGQPSGPSRHSLFEDICASVNAVAANTEQALGATFADFRHSLNQLHGRLGSVEGARIVRLALDPIFDRFAAPAVRTAAWQDVVAAFWDDDVSAQLCEARVRELAELAEVAGHEWASLARSLDWVLGDERAAIATLRDLPAGASTRDYAGLEEDERLRLCDEVAARDPRTGSIAVWLVVANASLSEGWLRKGPVQLFAGWSWEDDHLQAGGALATQHPDYEVPPELADMEGARPWLRRVALDEIVLARVFFEDGLVAHAARRARQLMEALIEVSAPSSEWELYDGYFAHRQGGDWFGSSLHPPGTFDEDRRRHSAFDPAPEGLQDLDPAFVGRLGSGEATAWTAVSEVRWSLAVGRIGDPRQQLALGTRALERTVASARTPKEEWYEAAERYLLAPWLTHVLYDELFDTGLAALFLHRTHHRDADAYADLRERVMERERPGREVFALAGFAEAMDDLLAGHLPGSTTYRLLIEAQQVMESPAHALQRIGEKRELFSRLVRRTDRQRNTILHGGQTVPEVLTTLVDFAEILGSYAAQEAMGSALTGAEPLADLERRRVELLENEARLELGARPLDVLFSAELLDPSVS